MRNFQSHDEDKSGYTFDTYSADALASAIYTDKVRVLTESGDVVALYPFMKLAGEAGEVVEKIAKIIRDDEGIMTEGKREALIYELGDVLWYVNACAAELGISLRGVAHKNIKKLERRVAANTLHGSGDER